MEKYRKEDAIERLSLGKLFLERVYMNVEVLGIYSFKLSMPLYPLEWIGESSGVYKSLLMMAA